MLPTLGLMFVRCSGDLLRGHADCAVEPDGFAVEHVVLNNVLNERSKLRRFTESVGKWHLLSEGSLRSFRQSGEQRRLEDSRRDGADANAGASEFTRERQGHTDNAALRRRVRDLADLAFISRNGSSGDDDAATTVFIGLIGAHGVGGVADGVKGPDEVDLDGANELAKIVHAVFAEKLLRDADARCCDEKVKSILLFGRTFNRGGDLSSVSDVSLGESDVSAKFLRKRLAACFIYVSDGDLCAFAGEHTN